MAMDKSSRQQTIQMIILIIVLLTVAGVLASLAGCERQLPPKEKAFITKLKSTLPSEVDSAQGIDEMVKMGWNVCGSLADGLSFDEIIRIIGVHYSATETYAIYEAATATLCP